MEKTAQNEYLKIVVIAVIVGVLAFGAGMKWQQQKTSTFLTANNFGGNSFAGRTGAGGMMGNGQYRTGMMGGARGGFRPVSGEIISADDTSITVKLADGSSKIILLSKSTTINKADKGSVSDLVSGKQVAVFGSENSDGSVTATSIQLDPVQMGMMIRGGATPSATTKPNAY